jgi:hypothetical protein
MALSRLWLEHALYDAVRCELQIGTNCRKNSLRQISVLSWGSLQQLTVSSTLDARFYKSATGELNWCFIKGELPCHREHELQITMKMDERDLVVLR